MQLAMPVMRLPAAPAVAELRMSRPTAVEAVLLGLRGLLREAEESSPAGEIAPARAGRTETVASQPRARKRPRDAVD